MENDISEQLQKIESKLIGTWESMGYNESEIENTKRPDIALYLNGIALGVLELKRASVSASEGIRQNLDNQQHRFIKPFFSTIQTVLAGNDSQGLFYGTTKTPEKFFLKWKEDDYQYDPNKNILDQHLLQFWSNIFV